MEAIAQVTAMVRVKWQMHAQKLNIPADCHDLRFCYDILKNVSRSFAAVIIQLDAELRDAVCLFYLLLRALDTVEDDVTVDPVLKERLLLSLHEKVYDPEWCIDGIGHGDEKRLLQQFNRVSAEIRRLKPSYQSVLTDICRRMGEGMDEFQRRTVETMADYDLYCHYVAGLVGHGLTQLFAASGLESASLCEDLAVANSMGLFLQKVNIIRDYFEDILEVPPRVFWPREAWSKFAPTIKSFRDTPFHARGVECINFLVADAVRHIPDCVRYLSALTDPTVFHFCAIPQVMAIGTLLEVYGNANVLTTKVKLSKGKACQLMVGCTTLADTLGIFAAHIRRMEHAANDEDPSVDVLRANLAIARAAVNDAMGKPSTAYARQIITQYPALGGQFLYSLVDQATGYFRN